MKNKRVISVILSVLMLALVCCSPLISYASFFVKEGDVVSCPGNMRAYLEPGKYNYSWLDSVIIRDGSMAVTPLTIYPVCDYPYSHTYAEFISECNNYMTLFEASDSVVQDTVMDSLKTVYYTLVATGKITDSSQEMRAYNESCGIVYPYTDSKFTDMYTALTYVCLDKDLYKLVSDEEITITRGTTVEGAVVKFLSTMCDMEVPSSVETIPAFSYLFTEKYVIEDSKYPVSENPSEEEVYYWVKLQAAEKAGYDVPSTTRYEDLSSEQIDYVTYAYDASILTTRYDAPIDPISLKAAILGSNPSLDVPVLVLKSMLDYVSVSYNAGQSAQSLFDMACKEGFFELDKEFYTDIFNYNLYVSPECEKIWITAFPIAEQLEGGLNSEVSTYINGQLVKNSSTNAVPVSAGGNTFTVKTTYGSRNESSTYVFTVIKTGDSESMNKAPSIDLSQPLSDLSNNISNVLSGVSSNTNDLIGSGEGYKFDTQLTTYPVSDGVASENTTSVSSGSLFETYATDANGEVLTTRNPLEVSQAEGDNVSVIANFSNTVKENPVVVVVPTGLIAIGASAGFLFYRRRKVDEDIPEDIDE